RTVVAVSRLAQRRGDMESIYGIHFFLLLFITTATAIVVGCKKKKPLPPEPAAPKPEPAPGPELGTNSERGLDASGQPLTEEAKKLREKRIKDERRKERLELVLNCQPCMCNGYFIEWEINQKIKAAHEKGTLDKEWSEIEKEEETQWQSKKGIPRKMFYSQLGTNERRISPK
ncbi:hypothetical protein PFISCL1PPCAC_23078, partial [Pristionchus fissidentatus]